MSFGGLDGTTEGGGNKREEGSGCEAAGLAACVIPEGYIWQMVSSHQMAVCYKCLYPLCSGRIQGLFATPEKIQTFLFFARWPLTVYLERP